MLFNANPPTYKQTPFQSLFDSSHVQVIIRNANTQTTQSDVEEVLGCGTIERWTASTDSTQIAFRLAYWEAQKILNSIFYQVIFKSIWR